jgi:hypothetical protein
MTRPIKGEAASTVEAALHTYPLTPAPPQLKVNIMRRIAQLTRPRFRLTTLDYALTLFGSSMAATPLIIWQTLTPQMILRLEIALYYLNHLITFPNFVTRMFGA